MPRLQLPGHHLHRKAEHREHQVQHADRLHHHLPGPDLTRLERVDLGLARNSRWKSGCRSSTRTFTPLETSW